MTEPIDVGGSFAPERQCGQTLRDPCQKRVAGMAFNFSAVACPGSATAHLRPFPPQSVTIPRALTAAAS